MEDVCCVYFLAQIAQGSGPTCTKHLNLSLSLTFPFVKILEFNLNQRIKENRTLKKSKEK